MNTARMSRSDAGATMVELVIALAVFTAGAVALMGGLVTLTTHSAMADERARATNFARSTFEDLRGLSIDDILAYEVPADDAELGTITIAGIGTVNASAFAVLPDGQGTFTLFELGVDDPSGLDMGTLPNPIEIRLVTEPVQAGEDGYSQVKYSSSTRIPY